MMLKHLRHLLLILAVAIPSGVLVAQQKQQTAITRPTAGFEQITVSAEFTGLLGMRKSVNMNTTNDQAIQINASKYVVRKIVVTNSSTDLTTAVGGFYTGASKSGTTVVANSQTYIALTGSTKFQDCTLAASPTTDVLTSNLIYLSLTIAQGGAATADVYIFGDPLF